MTTESQIEQSLISKLTDLKYAHRPEIRDRASLEANFRVKFEELKHVKLLDSEFARLIFLADQGCMAIILPHGVLFRGGAEEKIRRKLLVEGAIDTVIGLPANLFFSTGIPVCILVLKRCKKPDDVLFINAAECFEKGKRQNRLLPEHIEKIVSTYQFRKEEGRFSRRVPMGEIVQNEYNLNISRYVSTAVAEEEIDLDAVHKELVKIEARITDATAKHNEFLAELGLPYLPGSTIGTAASGKKKK
jgi:type I restriction enzyme M protein